MIVGAVMIAGALGLFFHNQNEQAQAAEAVNAVMPQIVEVIQQRQQAPAISQTSDGSESVQEPVELKKREMTAVEIDGYDYIGFIGLPTLQQELPVMADWSYPQLKISPCRFAGSIYTDNLVLMAHNYSYHFGSLKDLRVGDTVTFTDMDGQIIYYQVVAMDVLDPYAVEEMNAGEYDLTLFTCTYSGTSRVTVRCDRVEAALTYDLLPS